MRIILGFIVGLIILTGAYFAFDGFLEEQSFLKENKQETVENEENIDTRLDYKNSEYGFSLKYPSDWQVQEALKPQEIRALHEIVFFEKEYEMHRASLTVRIFTNDTEQTVDEWWNEWLSDEDIKKEECIAEYGEGNAPCLFLHDLVENEEETVLAGLSAYTVRLFRFDSEEECVFVAHGEYIYGLCYDGENPNDPDFEVNKEITKKIRESFNFDEDITNSSKNIAERILGRWQNIADTESVKVFDQDGTTEDVYANDTIRTGTWEIVDVISGIGESPTGAFLRTVVEDEEFFYTIVSLSEEELELTYLARGNTLKFTRE